MKALLIALLSFASVAQASVETLYGTTDNGEHCQISISLPLQGGNGSFETEAETPDIGRFVIINGEVSSDDGSFSLNWAEDTGFPMFSKRHQLNVSFDSNKLPKSYIYTLSTNGFNSKRITTVACDLQK